MEQIFRSTKEGSLSKIRVQEDYNGNLTLSVDDANGNTILGVGGNTACFYKGQSIINLSNGFTLVTTPTQVAEGEIAPNEYVLENGKWQVLTIDGITKIYANINGDLKSIAFADELDSIGAPRPRPEAQAE